MLFHPNETLSIYALPELCSKAWDRAATPESIKSGFRKSGFFPIDRNIFQDHEYLCSSVSDRPVPKNEERTNNINIKSTTPTNKDVSSTSSF